MISVIICSITPARFATVTASFKNAMGDEPHEIIGIHDARGLAEGYNRAIPAAKGEIIIFCHDDVEILNPDLPARLKKHMSRYDLIGIAGTDKLIAGHWAWAGFPHVFGQIANPRLDGEPGELLVTIFSAPSAVVENIQALDGVFMAARKSLLTKMTFDDATFKGFHLYDLDFSYSAFRAGMKLAVVNDINLLHASAGKFTESWQQDAERFREKWITVLPPTARPKTSFAAQAVKSRSQAVVVMNPPFWKYNQPPSA